MTRDEQLIRAALEVAAGACAPHKDDDSLDAQCKAECALRVRAIDPAEVLAGLTPAPDTDALTMTYRNWRGEVGKRSIVPIRVWFGATEWHPEPGWLLSALDMEKGVERDFALADCEFAALTVTPQPTPDAVARLVEAGRPCTDCGQTHDDEGDLCPTCVCVRAEIAAMEADQ